MSYVRCINNTGYAVSLTLGRVYKILPYTLDEVSLRVIDNEGEDYLYDASRFEPVEFTPEISERSSTFGKSRTSKRKQDRQ